jgi:hypothetical protein
LNPDARIGQADRGDWIVEDHLRDDGLDADPCGHRTRQLGERIPDQPEREHEQCEQEDHAGELTDRHIARIDPNRPEQYEADVRDRWDHVGERVEPASTLDGLHARHPNTIGKSGQADGLPRFGTIGLHQLHTLEALVDASREVAEGVLRSGVVTRDRSFVNDVGGDHQREDDHRHDAEWDVDDEQPDRRDDDHQNSARRERDRSDHTHRRFGVDTSSRHQVTVWVATMPHDGLTHEPIEHLIRVALRHAPHPGGGERSTEHHTHRTNQPDSDDHSDPGAKRADSHVAHFETRQDHIVDHPSNCEARGDCRNREDRRANEREHERTRMQSQHRPDEAPIAPEAVETPGDDRHAAFLPAGEGHNVMSRGR